LIAVARRAAFPHMLAIGAGVLPLAVAFDSGDGENRTKYALEVRMVLESSAFAEGATIPEEFTCSGTNVSPPLAWDHVPGGRANLALIADDPDTRGVWVHGIMYNLPAEAWLLPQALRRQGVVLNGVRQGINNFRVLGYDGPCPPPGAPHRYVFTLFALDTAIDLAAGATKQEPLDSIAGHVLAEGTLTGTYGR
jgi:Raf kinase inhibitor-like YbhB/YbcL family protein